MLANITHIGWFLIQLSPKRKGGRLLDAVYTQRNGKWVLPQEASLCTPICPSVTNTEHVLLLRQQKHANYRVDNKSYGTRKRCCILRSTSQSLRSPANTKLRHKMHACENDDFEIKQGEAQDNKKTQLQQGQIQEFAKGGPVPPVPFHYPSSFSFPLPQFPLRLSSRAP